MKFNKEEIKEIFKGLISDKDEVSHRRVISLSSFIILIALTVIYIIYPTKYNELIFISFASLSLGESILTRFKLK